MLLRLFAEKNNWGQLWQIVLAYPVRVSRDHFDPANGDPDIRLPLRNTEVLVIDRQGGISQETHRAYLSGRVCRLDS